MQKNRSLNILISSFGYINGPGYQRTFKLATELAKLGHNVTFLTSQINSLKFPYSIRKKNDVNEVAVFDFMPKKIKKLGLSPISTFLKILYILGKKYDIVHADSGLRPSSGIPCWIYKYIYKVKYISEWWDYFGKGGQYDNKSIIWQYTYGIYDNYMEIRDKKIADGVIPLSNFLRKRALSFGIKDDKIKVINGGSDTINIKFVNNAVEFRNEYNIPVDAFVFGFVGMNDGELEDISTFIKCLPRIKCMKKIVLLTTGSRLSKGKIYEYKLGDILNEMGFLNYKTDYYKVLSCVNVFVLTLENTLRNMGRWPNKLGDYMAAGRPTVVFPTGDLKNYIYRFPEAVIEVSMAEEKLIKDLENIIHMGNINTTTRHKNIRTIAEKYINWSNRAEQLINFYRKILI